MAANYRPTMSLRLPVLLLLLLLLGSAHKLAASTPASDLDTLLTFKNSLISFDAASAVDSWSNSSSAVVEMCQWQGVACNADGRVTALHLPGTRDQFLLGALPSILAQLDNLQELDLSGNAFSGDLPVEWARLQRLQKVDVGRNKITGGLPEPWSSMTALTHMNVSDNRLAGGIPDALSALTNLAELDLSHNQFSGQIAGLSAGWSQLRVLSISENRFSDGLPPEISALAHLHTLQLHGNSLEGSIPDEWATGPLSTALANLDVSDNLLTGTLPEAWSSRMTQLTHFNARVNHLRGPLPESWSDMPSLQFIDVSRNAIDGPLPLHWGTMRSILRIELTNNDIQGTLPWVWGAMSRLRTLELNSNGLSGSLPPSWSGMVALKSMQLQSNRLSESIDSAASWTTMTNLTEIDLSSNRLSGALPGRWSGFPSLAQIELQGNDLSGEIPASWGAGAISAVLQHMDLSTNAVEGTLPDSWSGMQNLAKLRLAENKLQGFVPTSWTAMESLVELDLEANPGMDEDAVPWQLAERLDDCPTCPAEPRRDVPNRGRPAADQEEPAAAGATERLPAAVQPDEGWAASETSELDGDEDGTATETIEDSEGSEADSEVRRFVYDSEKHVSDELPDGDEGYALETRRDKGAAQTSSGSEEIIGLVMGLVVGILVLGAIVVICTSIYLLRSRRKRETGRDDGAEPPKLLSWPRRSSRAESGSAATPKRSSASKSKNGESVTGVMDVVVRLDEPARRGTPARYQPPLHGSRAVSASPSPPPRLSSMSPSMTPRTSHSGVLPVVTSARGSVSVRTSLQYNPRMSTESTGIATPVYSPGATPRSSHVGPLRQSRLSTGTTLMEPAMSSTPRVSEVGGASATPRGPEPSSSPGRSSFILRSNDLAKSRDTQAQMGLLLPPGPAMSQEWTPQGVARFNDAYASREGLITPMDARGSWEQSLAKAMRIREEQEIASQAAAQNLSVVPEASFEISAMDLSHTHISHTLHDDHPTV